jgi:hypothetical protein
VARRAFVPFIAKENSSARFRAMTKEEYDELLRAMKRVHAEHAATPEKARKFLQEEGLITETGELTPYYRPAD